MLKVQCPAPVEILKPLKEILESYGANVTLETDSKGKVEHPSGTLSFEHTGLDLVVTLEHNPGHLPGRLILGGIRQLVEETAEIYRKVRPVQA
jgi:hypothetical protein